MAVEAGGVPLAVLPAPANQRGDGLLAATLDTIGMVGALPTCRSCTWTPATVISHVGRSRPAAAG
jgi:hypothetical protein